MNDTLLKIIPYKDQFKESVIQALIELQKHEHNLSDTRKASTVEICTEYFDVMLQKTQTQNGNVLICLRDEKFIGFISYQYECEDTVFEEDNSNHYYLISDICILSQFQGQGISTFLFDAVFNDLKSKQFNGRVRICTLATNGLATAAYQKYGFRPHELIYEKCI